MILLPAGGTLVRVCVLPGPGASAASRGRRSVLQAAIAEGGWRTLGTCPGETRYRRVFWQSQLCRAVQRDRRWFDQSPSSPGLPGRCSAMSCLQIYEHTCLSLYTPSIHGGLWLVISYTRQDSPQDGSPDRPPLVIAVLPVHWHLSCLLSGPWSPSRPRHGPNDCPWRGPRVDCRIGGAWWSPHSDTTPRSAAQTSAARSLSPPRPPLCTRHIGGTPSLTQRPGKHRHTSPGIPTHTYQYNTRIINGLSQDYLGIIAPDYLGE